MIPDDAINTVIHTVTLADLRELVQIAVDYRSMVGNNCDHRGYQYPPHWDTQGVFIEEMRKKLGVDKPVPYPHAVFPEKESLVRLLFDVQAGNISCRAGASMILNSVHGQACTHT